MLKALLVVASLGDDRTRQFISTEIVSLGGSPVTPTSWLMPWASMDDTDIASAAHARLAPYLLGGDKLIVAEIAGGWAATGLTQA